MYGNMFCLENTANFDGLEKSRYVVYDSVLFLQVLLIENDINSRPFSEAVLACLPPLPWSFSEEEHLKNHAHLKREDLRHIRIFSVDPPGLLLFLVLVLCYPLSY